MRKERRGQERRVRKKERRWYRAVRRVVGSRLARTGGVVHGGMVGSVWPVEGGYHPGTVPIRPDTFLTPVPITENLAEA